MVRVFFLTRGKASIQARGKENVRKAGFGSTRPPLRPPQAEGTPKRRGSALTLVVLVSFIFAVGCAKEKAIDPASLRGGETRETLSAEYFTGKEAKAYAIAKEIPSILDSLYCYCDCKKHFDHKSLLTCYVDLHAKYCDVCMDEAFMAYDLHKQGYDAPAIRKAVDEKFGKGHN